MGKAARIKRNKLNNQRNTLHRGKVVRDPALRGSFAASGPVYTTYDRNAFLVDQLFDGRVIWTDLEKIGSVAENEQSAMLVDKLLRIPKIQGFMTDRGYNMEGYIQGRIAEGSLDVEFVPALILAEFAARAMINACYSLSSQIGAPLNEDLFSQVVNGVMDYMAPWIVPFREQLSLVSLRRAVTQKARWRAVDVLQEEVVFGAAA